MTQMGLEYLKHSETRRSNLANESIKQGTLDETKRSNLATESLRGAELDEKRRANLATEAETHRANVAREDENRRSNLAKEEENFRSNTAREYENWRHNTIAEQIDAQANTIKERQNQLKDDELSLKYAPITGVIKESWDGGGHAVGNFFESIGNGLYRIVADLF